MSVLLQWSFNPLTSPFPISRIKANRIQWTQAGDVSSTYARELHYWSQTHNAGYSELSSTEACWNDAGTILTLQYRSAEHRLDVVQWSHNTHTKIESLEVKVGKLIPGLSEVYKEFDPTLLQDDFSSPRSLFDLPENLWYCEQLADKVLIPKYTARSIDKKLMEPLENLFYDILDVIYSCSGVPFWDFQVAALKHRAIKGQENQRNLRKYNGHIFLTNPVRKGRVRADQPVYALIPESVGKVLMFGVGVLRPLVVQEVQQFGPNLDFSVVNHYIFGQFPRKDQAKIPQKPTGSAINVVLKSGLIPVSAGTYRQIVCAVIREKKPALTTPISTTMPSTLDIVAQHSRRTGDHLYAPSALFRATKVSEEVAKLCTSIGVAMQQFHGLKGSFLDGFCSRQSPVLEWEKNIMVALLHTGQYATQHYALHLEGSVKRVLDERPFQFGNKVRPMITL